MRTFDVVDATPLCTFRLLFGLAMAIESWRHYIWAKDYIIPFYFKWPVLQHLAPAPPGTESGMQAFFCALGAASLLMMICGARMTYLYRFSAFLFAVLYLWFFSFDAAHYNNHYYLISLLSLFFCATDANRSVVPQWQLKLFQVQILTVYFFAGICKLNSEWLRGYPTRITLFDAYDRAFADVFSEVPKARQLVIKDTLSILPQVLTWIISYGGLALDLTLPFILLPPVEFMDRPGEKPSQLRHRLRHFGIWLSVLFHGCNSLMFNIGIFPFMMICTNALFMTSSEIAGVTSTVARLCCCRDSDDDDVNPEHDGNIVTDNTPSSHTPSNTDNNRLKHSRMHRRLVVTLLCIHWALQWFLPLRHLAMHHMDARLGYACQSRGQRVGWTGAGEMFAWRMMLTHKNCTGHFEVVRRCECSGPNCCPQQKLQVLLAERVSRENLREERLHVSAASLGLTILQQWRVFADPFFTRQVATRGVRMRFPDSGSGWKVKEVYAHARCSLNGSPTQPYLNESLDLTEMWSWSWNQWIDPSIVSQTEFV